MIVYYINKVSERLSDYRYPIKEGDICMLYDGETVKTIYIDSERDTDSIWRDFKFIDSKSLKSYQFPTSNSILCAPFGKKHAIGNTGLLTQLIKECKGEWLLDFLNETSSILSGFVDYWDLEVLRRLTGDDEVKITYEEEDIISEFIDRPKENEIDKEDIVFSDVEDDFIPSDYNIRWFCLSALTCVEDKLDKCSYQILNDTFRGESRKSIAEKHRLTQERIRQIVVKATKQVTELLIEQCANLKRETENNAKLNVQLNLLKEEIVRLKALIPHELLPGQNDSYVNLDSELVKLLETPLNNIAVPARAFNILYYMGVKKFVDIPQIDSENKVLEMRNSGRKTTLCILHLLKDFHLTFGMSYTAIIDVLNSYDWSAAKRLWIRREENNEGIDENETIEPQVNDFEVSFHVDEVDAPSLDYIIENNANRCQIIDNRGKRLFSSGGQLIKLNNVFYKVNYLDSLVTVLIIQEDSKGMFSIGRRILSAHSRSPLYASLDENNYLKQFKAVKYDYNCDEYYVQVDDRWYGSSGYYADLNENENIENANSSSFSKPQISSVESKDFSELMEVEHVFLDSRGKIVEKITTSQLDFSADNRRGKAWTKEEEELITRYFNQGKSIPAIASAIGRTLVAVKSRLAKLGLIYYTYGQEEETLEENGEQLEEKISDTPKRDIDRLSVIKNPLYAVRKQAILRAMSFFRLPTKIKDIARTISRTSWQNTIKEEDVEDIISTMPEVESVDGGYVLRKSND